MVKKTLGKPVTVRKLFKNAIKCRQAEHCSSIRLDFRAKRVKEFTLNYADELDKNFFFEIQACIFYVSALISYRNIGKSVTDVKSFKRAFKCRQAELTSSSRLDFTSN